MRFFLSFLVLATFFSCQPKNEQAISFKKTNQFVIPYDSLAHLPSRVSSVQSTKDSSIYCITYSIKYGVFSLFDLSTGALRFRSNLNAKIEENRKQYRCNYAKDGKLVIEDIELASTNDIALLKYRDNIIIHLDTNGNITHIDSIELAPNVDLLDIKFHQGTWYGVTTGTVLNDSIHMMAKWKKPSIVNTFLQVPTPYLSQNFYDLRFPFFDVSEKGVLCGFPIESNITQFNHNNLRSTLLSLKKSGAVSSILPDTSREIQTASSLLNYRDQTSFYEHIIYDPYRKYTYRLVSHQDSLYLYNTTENSTHDNPWSVLIYDENYQFLNEIRFPAKQYYKYSLAVVPNGIVLMQYKNDFSGDTCFDLLEVGMEIVQY